MVRCASSVVLFVVKIVSLLFLVHQPSVFVRLVPVLHHGDQRSYFSCVVVSMFACLIINYIKSSTFLSYFLIDREVRYFPSYYIF